MDMARLQPGNTKAKANRATRRVLDQNSHLPVCESSAKEQHRKEEGGENLEILIAMVLASMKHCNLEERHQDDKNLWTKEQNTKKKKKKKKAEKHAVDLACSRLTIEDEIDQRIKPRYKTLSDLYTESGQQR